MEQLVREKLARHWQLTDREKEAFIERPMTSSDFAGIDSLHLYMNQKYKKYGYENVALQLNSYGEFRGLGKPDWDKCAEVEGACLTTLDDLENFTELNRLDLHMYWSNFTDLSALGKLTGLRELSIYMADMRSRMKDDDIAFVEELTNLRLFELYGWDSERFMGMGIEPTSAFEKITDLSVLTNCSRLKYLCLATGNVENYDFLGELPEIYYISLMGNHDMKNVQPDTALLPNGGYICHCNEEIYWDIGRKRRR